MITKKIFSVEESPYHPGKYIIRPKYEDFLLNSTEGSYNVICARLFNLSYIDYLRMCRDCFGAEIIGKNSLYPVAYFKRSNELTALVELLNARATSILWEREHPDYEEHKAYLKEKEPSVFEKISEKKI